MQNHYHLILRERTENGIARFMQKVGTMYTMYFNAKNDRVGGLFVRPFRSKHIDTDDYLKRVIQYVHLNPAELFEPGWKDGEIQDLKALRSSLQSYRYSSLPEHLGMHRPESSIIDLGLVHSYHDNLPTIMRMTNDAAAYYRDLRW
jgi:putative transposase